MTYYSEKRDLNLDVNAAFYYQQAFTGIFWYLHGKKSSNTFLLKNIVYESILEDLSPLDILKYGPEVVNIFKTIEALISVVDLETISEVSKLGLQIYQILSSCTKTKELAFYNALLQDPSQNQNHAFIKTLQGKNLDKVTLNAADKKWMWFKDFEKTPLYGLALEWFRLNDSDQLEEEGISPDLEYLPFPNITKNKILPTPITKYKATSTGINFNETEMTLSVATNILKRAFHIGLPIYDFKNFITSTFSLGNQVEVDLPNYYQTNNEEDYKRVLIFCLKACDVEFYDEESLFSVAYPLILMSESNIQSLARGKI